MVYKTLVCLNIAIIGYGKYAEALAKGLATVGHDIFFGLKDDSIQVSKQLLEKYKNVSVTTIEDAAELADIIIMATPVEEVREAAYLMDNVKRKVIIDTTAVTLNANGELTQTANAIKAITGSQHVVKCFNYTGYEDLVDPNVNEGMVEMFVAGDSKKGKELTKFLARDLGIVSCYDFGGNDIIPTLDGMAKCWAINYSKEKMSQSIAYKLVKR